MDDNYFLIKPTIKVTEQNASDIEVMLDYIFEHGALSKEEFRFFISQLEALYDIEGSFDCGCSL